ncbi:hypothetical protein SUGI_0772880 [Cryptomeria japonica]|nr:hypothetical protein SUGI_0772880 [Cryptomeria japonica]
MKDELCQGSYLIKAVMGNIWRLHGEIYMKIKVVLCRHDEVASKLEGNAKIRPQGRRVIVNDLLPHKEGGNILGTAMPHILSFNAAATISISSLITSITLIQLVLEKSSHRKEGSAVCNY